MEVYQDRSEREIKILERTDILVVGAGLGGICAALSAARAGMRVVLAEKNAVLGGQAAEIDTWGLDGFVDRTGRLAVKGYPWEILQETLKEGGSDPLFTQINLQTMQEKGIGDELRRIGLDAYVPYVDTGTFMNPFNDQYVNPNAYRYIAHRLLEQAGVEVLLGMPAVDVIMEESIVRGVVLQGEFEKFVVFAGRIVDTTQGASVCALAGKRFAWPKAYVGTLPRVCGVDAGQLIEYIRSTPEEQWFLRPMVGKRADPDEMEQLLRAGAPLAIHGFTGALKQAVKDDPAYRLIERMCDVLMFFYEADGVGAYWAIDDTLHHTNVSDPKEFAAAICAVRQQQWLVHKFFTRYIPGFAHAQLLDTYVNISKAYHQTWEPSGFTEYDITPEEIKNGRTEREDRIVKILGHPMSGQNAGGWYVPLAALIPKELDNILVTGKAACRKIHYIASCGLVGQAAGAAAVQSLRQGRPFRQTEAEAVRELLRQQNVLISEEV
ncbi:MAG: FAD-dependent oxidoreductase [Eubacteriales bacterium]|nr:FAD-dependent oxidoreductase [Eubacteriales bacterium]